MTIAASTDLRIVYDPGMDILDAAINCFADFLVGSALRFALGVDDRRKAALKRLARWGRARGSLRLLLRRWLLRRGALPPEAFRRPRGHRPHNRTPDEVELAIARLAAEHLGLGCGQLRFVAHRVLGVLVARETVRRILIRRQRELLEMVDARRGRPRRISVHKQRQLWGLDLTLVYLLGFFPVWLLGIVDYHGSRLVTLERCLPTTAAVTAALQRTFAEHGMPHRILSDNGPQFTSLDFELFLAAHGIDHTRTRPAHPWTNGRIERLFRTFKEIVFAHIWLFKSLPQIDRNCADFERFYNRDRPHSAYGGRTPDEVYFAKSLQRRSLGRVAYFDGALSWYRFG
ncbi:MAG: integrase core domain-containing protein [Myxococcales bacterium]